MAKVELISRAEYARRRGVSRVAVTKAIAAGRISLIDGMIDPKVADVQWAANSQARVHTGAQPQAGQMSFVEGDGTGAGVGVGVGVGVGRKSDAMGDGVGDGGYMDSRNRREAADAGLAELALAEAQGKLIRVDALAGVWSGLLSATREAFMQIGPRISSLLAAETDPAVVRQMVDAEHHQALQMLAGESKRLAALGADGAGASASAGAGAGAGAGAMHGVLPAHGFDADVDSDDALGADGGSV